MIQYTNRSVQILSMASCLPQRKVSAEELDQKLQRPAGWVFKNSGVQTRHYVENETAAEMGAVACRRAIERAEARIEDIDCIICASGSMQQLVPCTASLILEALGCKAYPACFDINSTCLSFVSALDVAAALIDSGRYSNCLLVSSEVASKNLYWEEPKGAVIFGDGAVCALLAKTPKNGRSSVGKALLRTYPGGAHLAQMKCGSDLPPSEYSEAQKADFLFRMRGPQLYIKTLIHIHGFIREFEQLVDRSLQSYAAVVPHQGSGSGLRHMQKHLKLPDEKFINIIGDYGNMIAASIPMALHLAVESGRIQRDDSIVLLGGGAGLGMGIVELCY